jgi:hypothetical protein
MARVSSRTDDGFALALGEPMFSAPEGWNAANSSELAAFFVPQSIFGRQKRSFFTRGPGERLRSLGETASYGSNSAVDSSGAAMSAFKEEGRA